MKVTLVEGKVVVDEGEDRPDDGAPVMVPAVLAPGDALVVSADAAPVRFKVDVDQQLRWREGRSEEHTAELQSLMSNSYAVFFLKKKNTINVNESDYLTTY